MFPTNNEYSMWEKLKIGLKNPRFAAQYLYYMTPPDKSLSLTANSRLGYGTNVFDLDWDLLVVLDSCRFDAMRLVAEEDSYDFMDRNSVRSIQSVGSATPEWTAATFTEEHRDKIENTAFISSNGWPVTILRDGHRPEDAGGAMFASTKWNTVSEDAFGLHKCGWNYGGRLGDQDQRQANGSVISDLAISLGRKRDYDRVIAHFLEPHYPYAGAARQRGATSLNNVELYPFEELLMNGRREEVWESYLQELRTGLNYISRLLSNYDAEKVLITADHGECFGEWGMYAHTRGSYIPQLRTVPLVETTAEDTGSHSPDIKLEAESSPDRSAIEENLKSLGYIK